jgi:O-antigen ligase
MTARRTHSRTDHGQSASAGQRLEGLAFWLLIALVALAPLPLGGNRPAAWSLLAAAVGAILVLWGAALALDGTRVARVPAGHLRWPALIMAVLIAWFIVQTLPGLPEALHHPIWQAAGQHLGQDLTGRISVDPDRTVEATMRFASYGGVFFLTCHLARPRQRARIAVWSVLLAGLAYAVYGLIVQFGNFGTILWYERWAYPDSLTSTFVNRNSYAAYAGLGILAALALLLHQVNRARGELSDNDPGIGAIAERAAGRAWLPMLALILMATALIMSDSRGGLGATALGLVTFLLLHVQGGEGRGRRTALIVAALLVVVVGIGEGTVFQRIELQGLNDIGVRLLIYRDVLAGIGEHFWTGTGFGTFQMAFEAYRGMDMTDAPIVDKAHNTYLEFAFEAGVPALLAFLTMLILILRQCWRGLHDRQRDRMFDRLALAAAVLIGSHSLIDFPAQIPGIAYLFAMILGLGVAQSVSSRIGNGV